MLCFAGVARKAWMLPASGPLSTIAMPEICPRSLILLAMTAKRLELAGNSPGGRVFTLRDPFPEGLHAEAGATRVPDNHHFTIKYAELFGLTLDPLEPPNVPAVYYVRGRRLRVRPGQKVDWPYELTVEERALGLNGIREKYIWSMLGELGDVTDPSWPSPEVLRKYDQINRSDFWRSRGASPEAIALMSVGGVDDRAETWSTLFMLRNQAIHQKITRYYKIRGGTDLLPKLSRLGCPTRSTTVRPLSESNRMLRASK
jgi:monoamine oxidase